MAVASAGVGVFTESLKLFFERPRPENNLRLVEVSGYSYPSGHSLASTAIYFTIAFIHCQNFRMQEHRILIVTFFSSLAALIAASRVYLGVHYFTDVIAGMPLGIYWASLLAIAGLYHRQ